MLSMLVDKWVDVRSTFKKLEETVHVARHFPEDSTYDSFWFHSKYFSKIWVSKLAVWVICVCVLCAGVYGNIEVQWYLWQTFFFRGEKWEFCPLCFLGGLLMLKELLCPSKMLTLNLQLPVGILISNHCFIHNLLYGYLLDEEESNSVLWLATRAGKMELSCPPLYYPPCSKS